MYVIVKIMPIPSIVINALTRGYFFKIFRKSEEMFYIVLAACKFLIFTNPNNNNYINFINFKILTFY